jgi:hypothetical protein
MAETVYMDISDLYATFMRQVHRFQNKSLRTLEGGAISLVADPEIEKIIIEDASMWRQRNTDLPKGTYNTKVAVMIPYASCSGILSQLINLETKQLTYDEIIKKSSYSEKNYYTLTTNIRNIAAHDFDKTKASYRFITGVSGGNDDFIFTAVVGGEEGNAVRTDLITATSLSVSTSGTTIIVNYNDGTDTAAEFSTGVNTATQYLVASSFSGDGSDVVEPAEEGSGAIYIATHVGASTSGVAGTSVGRAKARAKVSSTSDAYLYVGSIYAGASANNFTIDIDNTVTAESVSWANPTLTIAGDSISAINALTAWNTNAVPFITTLVGTTGVGAMPVTADGIAFSGGTDRPTSLTWKALYIHRTKNDDPEFVIMGIKQATSLGLV